MPDPSPVPLLVWVTSTPDKRPGLLLAWREVPPGQRLGTGDTWQGYVICASSYSTGRGVEVHVDQSWQLKQHLRPA